ncbi:TetR/AcrR family transcriptional regulator [Streptomyces sp. NPDC092296]|uniref:TetR/AcrR family transcriptional regulator n=1 Tax=Streptomyces sp. NPDC092296 TaxID=3366012 RepID=UPI00381803F2
MSPRRASVNEAMRQRSRERIMKATAELVDGQGYAGTTLADIARHAGIARGLVSYYFSGKRLLLQSAVHREMHLHLAAELDRLPDDAAPDARLACAVDSILGFALAHPRLMRSHLALILDPDAGGFVQDPEQRRLGALLQGVLLARGSTAPEADHAVLRASLMGGCMGVLLPGAETPLVPIRADLFARYGLAWHLGAPPQPQPSGRPAADRG